MYKDVFSKDNITSFIIVALAVVVSVVYLVPLWRQFVPGAAKKTTTSPSTTSS